MMPHLAARRTAAISRPFGLPVRFCRFGAVPAMRFVRPVGGAGGARSRATFWRRRPATSRVAPSNYILLVIVRMM